MLETADTFQLLRETISSQMKQVGDGSPVESFTGHIGNRKSSLEAPVIERSGFGPRNDVKPAINLFSGSSAKNVDGTGSVGKLANETPASMDACTKDVEHVEVGKRIVDSTRTGAAPFGLQSTGKFSDADVRPLPFTVSRSFFSNAQERIKPNSISSESQSSNQLFSSDDSNTELRSLISSSSKATQSKGLSSSFPSTGDVELAPTVRGSHIVAKDGSLPGKLRYSWAEPLLENIRASKFPHMLDSEQEFSKQFYNVRFKSFTFSMLLN